MGVTHLDGAGQSLLAQVAGLVVGEGQRGGRTAGDGPLNLRDLVGVAERPRMNLVVGG